MEAITRQRKPRFDITTEPEYLQKKWIRRALIAHNHNTGDTLTFEDVWGVWDVRECGPQTWAKVTARNNIKVHPFPRFFNDEDPERYEAPTPDELLGETCIGNGLHDWDVNWGEDIIRVSTEVLRAALYRAYSPKDPRWIEFVIIPL